MFDNLNGHDFEFLIQQLLTRMGYRVQRSCLSRDNGVDLRASSEDPLFGGLCVVQCKHLARPVGEPEVRDLAGVVSKERAIKGILITTSTFTEPARKWVEGMPVQLIDCEQLVELYKLHFPEGHPQIPRPSPLVPLLRLLAWRRHRRDGSFGVPLWCWLLGLGCLAGAVLMGLPFILRAFTDIKKDVTDLVSKETSKRITPETAPRPQPTNAEKTIPSSSLRITVKGPPGTTPPLRLDAFMFSPLGLEREERIAGNMTWEHLEPGEKIVHLLPSRNEAPVAGQTLYAKLVPGQTAALEFDLQPALTLEGGVVSTKGVDQAYTYAQAVQLPFALSPSFKIASLGLLQQADASGEFQKVEGTSLSRWTAVRLISPTHVTLGSFTGANGRFAIRGLRDRVVRVQAAQGDELVYDDLRILDGSKVTLTVAAGSGRMDADHHLRGLLPRLQYRDFEAEVRAYLSASALSHIEFRSALKQMADEESFPPKKQALGRLLQ